MSAMKPDYGLRLIQDGVSRDVDLFFYAFALFSITVLGRGQYSTTADRQHDGEWYALSLDFRQQDLDVILSRIPASLAASLRHELSRDPVAGRTIDLPVTITVPIRARLGTLSGVRLRHLFLSCVRRS